MAERYTEEYRTKYPEIVAQRLRTDYGITMQPAHKAEALKHLDADRSPRDAALLIATEHKKNWKRANAVPHTIRR